MIGSPPPRTVAIIALYRADKTFQEIGEAIGFTGGRAQQIIQDAIGRGWVERRARWLPRHFDKFRAYQRSACLARLLEDNPDRNIEAESLLAEGLTYGQVAEKIGTTRNAVAGIANRARKRAAYAAEASA